MRDPEPTKLRFAAREGVSTVYKFRPYATEQHRRFVREILVEHKVWFARASSLNDDRDLRPIIRFRGSTNAEVRRLLLDDAAAAWARRSPPYTAEELQRVRNWWATEQLEVLEAHALQRVHDRLEECYWICSLSASRDPVAMWDDYADRRRGLCVHFRADGHSPFGYAQRVVYQPEPPILLVPLGESRDVADVCLLRKTLRWQIEQEYRLIKYPDFDELPEVQMWFDGQHAHFPAAAITGITVGPDMQLESVKEILQLAEAHDPPLPVFRPNSITEAA